MSWPSTPLLRTAYRTGFATAFAAAVIFGATAGCTPERGETDADDAGVVSTLAVPVVTPPPERQTPFCQIMLDLDESLPADPTIDVTDEVLDAYREALPVAPSEIVDELEAVIVGLETDTDPTLPTTSIGGEPAVAAEPAPEPAAEANATPSGTFVPPTATAGPISTLETPSPEEAFDGEGYVPDDNPAVRLAEFVDFTCRDNINNPGPPATQPSATPVPTTDS